MKSVQKMSIGAVVGTLAATVAIWTALDPWHVVGWETPDQHKADIAELRNEYTLAGSASEDILNKIQENRDEWKCDEYSEELSLNRRRLSREDNPNSERALDLKDLIDKIEKKMEQMDCSRFDDFG